jgi:hypothetical protein
VTHCVPSKGVSGGLEQCDEEASDKGCGRIMRDCLVVFRNEVTHSMVRRGKAYTTYLEGHEVEAMEDEPRPSDERRLIGIKK